MECIPLQEIPMQMVRLQGAVWEKDGVAEMRDAAGRVGWAAVWVGVWTRKERRRAGSGGWAEEEGQSGRRQLGKALGKAVQGCVCFGRLPT